MGARARRRRGWRTSKSTSRAKKSNQRSEAWQPEIADNGESAETEEIDRLLLSSLKFWEVERDLIEERLAVSRSARNGALHRRDIAA
jgi:hypothetical protein